MLSVRNVLSKLRILWADTGILQSQETSSLEKMERRIIMV